MRSLARETVFQYLFSRLFNQSDEGLFDVLANKLNGDDKSFAEKLLKAVENNREKYETALNDISENFRFNRIFAADKCAVFIGMAELDAFAETPKAVIIDEAVKLSAKFSTEKSTDFVNGILAKYDSER